MKVAVLLERMRNQWRECKDRGGGRSAVTTESTECGGCGIFENSIFFRLHDIISDSNGCRCNYMARSFRC